MIEARTSGFGAALLERWRAQPAVVRRVIWPAAIVAYLLQVGVAADAPYSAYDLRPVWLAANAFIHGGDPYFVSDVTPFLYPPGSLVFLAPFGGLPWVLARGGYFVFEVLAVPLGLGLTIAAMRRPVVSVVGAGMLLGLALFEPATSALVLHNFTVVSFLGMALYLWLAARDRWTWAAVALGVALTLKPLMPLLILHAILFRRWRSALVATAIPVVLSLIVLPMVAGERFEQAMRFLVSNEVGGTVSASLVTLGVHLGLPPVLTLVVRVLLFAVIVWTARRIARRPGEPDVVSIETAGVLMLAQLLCFSITWTHYGLLLVPWLATIVADRSLMRKPLVVAGAVVVAIGAETIATQFGFSYAATLSMTVGLLLMTAGVVAAALASPSAGARAEPGEDVSVSPRSPA
jgi:hypothetical protein